MSAPVKWKQDLRCLHCVHLICQTHGQNIVLCKHKLHMDTVCSRTPRNV